MNMGNRMPMRGRVMAVENGERDVTTTASPDGNTVMRDLLEENIGAYIISEHLVGTGNLVSKEGVLVRVESNAFVLYNEANSTYIHCDYYSLKFFHRVDDGIMPDAAIMNQSRTAEGRTAYRDYPRY